MPDLSRWSFDPRKTHALSIAQQGRVLLDSDLNAQAAILDRRLRADGYDLAGLPPISGVRGIAAVPATTPHAFKIESGSIRPGRMYVDGILVENHGTGATMWDAALEESIGSASTPFGAQPWLTGSRLPTDSGLHLVYLVVARREVDALLDPDLVDSAFDLDTAVRLQTVWQVRTLRLGTDHQKSYYPTMPDEELEGWETTIAPSGGRLTTSVAQPSNGDPCILPPTAGYRGLDNQLYRVQCVFPGHIRTARFVFSRENASVRALVTEIVDERTLRVSATGRDGVLGFRAGDLVQLLDEQTELGWIGAPSAPNAAAGQFCRVAEVREDQRLVILSADVATQPADLTAARLRLIRWEDVATTYDANGMPVHDSRVRPDGTFCPTDAPVTLERGITITFSTVGDRGFLLGDSFVFGARYPSGDLIDGLDAAPPSGIHRHYARLGLWNGTGFADWRRITPAAAAADDDCGCCDIRVTPEGHNNGSLTIGDAIQKMSDRGGVVILCPGTYEVREPIDLSDVTDVIVRGSGPASRIDAPNGAFRLTRCTRMTFEDFSVVSSEAPSTPQIVIDETTRDTLLQRLRLSRNTTLEPRGVPSAVRASLIQVVEHTASLRIRDCRLEGGGIGTLGANGKGVDGVSVEQLLIEDCHIEAAAPIAFLPEEELGTTPAVNGEWALRRNTITSSDAAIRLWATAGASPRLEIVENDIQAVTMGIVLQPDAAQEAPTIPVRIADNVVRRVDGEADDWSKTMGVAIVPVGTSEAAIEATLASNRIEGWGYGIQAIRQALRLDAFENTIRSVAVGMLVASPIGAVRIADNTIRTLVTGSEDDAQETDVCGIAVVATEVATVTGNLVDGAGELDVNFLTSVPQDLSAVGLAPNPARARGIFIAVVRESTVVSNTVRNLAPATGKTSAVGIEVCAPVATVLVATNTVHSLRSTDDLGVWQPEGVTWQSLVIRHRPELDDAIPSLGVGLTLGPFEEGRSVTLASAKFVVPASQRLTVGVHDNVLGGHLAEQPAVVVGIRPHEEFDSVLRFSGNGVAGEDGSNVHLEAHLAAVVGNTMPYCALEVIASVCTIVGNIVQIRDVIGGGEVGLNADH